MSTLKDDFKTTDIKTMVKQIQNRIVELKKQGVVEDYDIESKLYEDLPEFYDEYPFLVKKLVSGGDMSVLYRMLDTLESVQKGKKSFAGAELALGKELADDYLHPAVKKENERVTKEQNKK